MLNIKEFNNNIYGAEDIKDDKYIFEKVDSQIRRQLENGIRNFAIYPMGFIGREVYHMLSKIYSIVSVILIDDELCKFSDNIISFEDFIANPRDAYLLLASNNLQYYDSLRERVKQCLKKTNFHDLFPLKPLYRKDSRIISLELASREIYKYGIEGAVAELGVYRGYFAEYINYFFYDRKFYLFDTFCGFDERDIEIEKRQKFSEFEAHKAFLDTNESIILDKMKAPEYCVFVKGYFPESISNINEEKYCFVHLDTDLYMPTLNGLNYFYPRLSKGGYIFIHDFNGLAQGVRTAVKEFCEKNNIGYVCLPDSIIKGTVVITK